MSVIVSVLLAELSPRIFCTFPRELSSRRRTLRIALDELSGVWERPMIISMPTTARTQQRYDHRLRNLVQRTQDVTIATDLGVPRSTARGWLAVVCRQYSHCYQKPPGRALRGARNARRCNFFVDTDDAIEQREEVHRCVASNVRRGNGAERLLTPKA